MLPVFEIRAGGLDLPQVAALLEDHLRGMAEHTPPASIHALPLEGLKSPAISFFTAWEAGDLLGCGALKELDPKHGEIKSMRTAQRHLRRGVAACMLTHLIGEAQRRGYARLSLETGSVAAFEPAIALYQSFGFQPGAPFADYGPDPFSRYFHLELA